MAICNQPVLTCVLPIGHPGRHCAQEQFERVVHSPLTMETVVEAVLLENESVLKKWLNSTKNVNEVRPKHFDARRLAH